MAADSKQVRAETVNRSSCEVVLAPKVLEALEAIPDPRLRGDIVKRVDGLKINPADQGRALTGEFSGFYVLRNSEAGYRIIYRVEGERVVIYAVAVDTGRSMTRPDIHSLARRMVAMKMFEPTFLNSAPEAELAPEPEPAEMWDSVLASKRAYELAPEDVAKPRPEIDSKPGSEKKSARKEKPKSQKEPARGSKSTPKKSARPKDRKKQGGKPNEYDHE